MINPSEEKLKRMLEEGKITPEQFEELKANLPEKEEYNTETTVNNYSTRAPLWERFKRLPLNLQICIAILALSIIGGLLYPLSSSRHGLFPVAIVSVVLNLMIAFGIINLRKWAFWLGIAFGALAFIMCLAALPRSFFSLLLNGSFVALLWASKEYFDTIDQGSDL